MIGEQMEKIGGPGGLFGIFRFIQYMPYVVIGILIVMVVFWVIFGIKKFKWAKTLAIILTILAVISSLLIFTPYIIGTIAGKEISLREFFGNKDFPRSGKDQFRDFRDRQDDEREKKKSGLDIETNFQLAEVNGEIIIL
jgi:hypothetical protein